VKDNNTSLSTRKPLLSQIIGNNINSSSSSKRLLSYQSTNNTSNLFKKNANEASSLSNSELNKVNETYNIESDDEENSNISNSGFLFYFLLTLLVYLLIILLYNYVI